MDLRTYFNPIIKWWWLLAAAVVLAAGSSYALTLRQPPIYQSNATLMIGQTINDPNPAQNQFYLEQQLASIYAGMAMRSPIRQATMEALGMDWLPAYNVYAQANSQLIEVVVQDTNPVRAQAVAAELANQIVMRSPTNIQMEDQSRQEFIQEQLDDMQSQIQETRAEIEKLELELGDLNSARQIQDTQSEIASLNYKLSLLQSNYAALLGNTQQGAPNSITIIEPAGLPMYPVGPNRMMTVVMSAIIGLAIAAVGAYAIEFFDPTFRTAAEVSRSLKMPIIGQIASIPRQYIPHSFVREFPLSPVGDAFRSLRNSLDHFGLGTKFKSLQVCSSDVSEGKTTIASNLAIAFAKAGKKVILVDGDVRKSSLTQHFELQDCRGLTDVLAGDETLSNVIYPSTKVANLWLVPAGKNLELNHEILDTLEMHEILTQLENHDLGTDVVIFDSTPAVISDAMILAREVKNVVFVVRLGRSKRDQVKYVKEQFAMADVNVLGIIINEMPARSAYSGGSYRKYASYYQIQLGTSGLTNGHRKKGEWVKSLLGGRSKKERN